MLTAKERTLQFIKSLPDDLSIDEIEQKILHNIRYEKHVIKMIEQGQNDVAEGRIYSSEEIAEMLGIKL